MKIIYHSFTGNCERFAKKLDETAVSIKELPKLTENAVLIFPTVGFGIVPLIVKKYLRDNREYIKFVIASGNKNWGPNFAKGADIITEKLGIPSYKIELAGTEDDVLNIKEIIAHL